MPCTACADPWRVYLTGDPIGPPNLARHSALYRCTACGTHYEVVPEGRQPPRRITAEEALELFGTDGGD